MSRKDGAVETRIKYQEGCNYYAEAVATKKILLQMGTNPRPEDTVYPLVGFVHIQNKPIQN